MFNFSFWYQVFLLTPYLFTLIFLLQCTFNAFRESSVQEANLNKSLWGIAIITLLTLIEHFMPGIWGLKQNHQLINLFLTTDLILISLVAIFDNVTANKKKLLYLLTIPALLTCLIFLNIISF